MYIELYGKQPVFNSVKDIAKQTVWPYLPGINDTEKEQAFSTIYSVAVNWF